MSDAGARHLLYLLDEAFDGTPWHSLLGNLSAVAPEAWTWVPPGGHRSIRDIVQHVGACKFMYHDHAFGDARLAWEDRLVTGDDASGDVATATAWLREGHARLRRSVALLDDAELPRPRKTNWGELKETRWIIAVLIQHDLYHAGEINHIRSLQQQHDRWAFDQG